MEIGEKKDRGQASPGGCCRGAVQDEERRHRLQYSERASEGPLEAHNFGYIDYIILGHIDTPLRRLLFLLSNA
jgi:hypothetical protein